MTRRRTVLPFLLAMAVLAMAAVAVGYLTAPAYLEAQGDEQQPISNVSHAANPAKAVVSWSNSSSLHTRIDWMYTNVKKDGGSEERTWAPFDWNVAGTSATFTQRPHVHGGDVAGETITIRLSVEIGPDGALSTPVEYTFTVPSQLLPPQNLAAEQDGDDLLVTWEHSYPGAPPEEHVVRWSPVGASASVQETTIAAATSHRIPNARNEQYVVEVSNVYDRARDIRSPFASVRPDVIGNLTAELRGPDTVGVRWNAASGMTNAAFVVQVHVAGSDALPVYEQAVAVTPGSSSYFHEITLESNSEYDIYVRHATGDGSGNVVSIGEAYSTSIRTPMYPPQNLSSVPGDGSVALLWDANPGNTAAHRTTVRYRQPGQQWQYHTAASEGVNLASLEPGRYELGVLTHPAAVAAADYFHQQYTPFPASAPFTVSNFAAAATENAIAVSWDQVSYVGYTPDLPSVRHRDYRDPDAPGAWTPSAHGQQLEEGVTSHNITGLAAGTDHQVELLYTGLVDGAVQTYSAAKLTTATTGTRSTGTAPVAPAATPTADATRSSDVSFESLSIQGLASDTAREDTHYSAGKTSYEFNLSEDLKGDVSQVYVYTRSRTSAVNLESTYGILHYDVRRTIDDEAYTYATLRLPHGERTEFKFTIVSEDGLHEQEYTVALTRPAQQVSLLPGPPVYGYVLADNEYLRVDWSANPDGATPTAYKLRYAQVRGEYTGVPGVDSMHNYKYDVFWNLSNLQWTEVDVPAYEVVRRESFTVENLNGKENRVSHPLGFAHDIIPEDLIFIGSPYQTRSLLVGYIVEAAAVNNHGQSNWVRLLNATFSDVRNGDTFLRPRNHDNIVNTPHVRACRSPLHGAVRRGNPSPWNPVVWADARNYRLASVESHG